MPAIKPVLAAMAIGANKIAKNHGSKDWHRRTTEKLKPSHICHPFADRCGSNFAAMASRGLSWRRVVAVLRRKPLISILEHLHPRKQFETLLIGLLRSNRDLSDLRGNSTKQTISSHFVNPPTMQWSPRKSGIADHEYANTANPALAIRRQSASVRGVYMRL